MHPKQTFIFDEKTFEKVKRLNIVRHYEVTTNQLKRKIILKKGNRPNQQMQTTVNP